MNPIIVPATRELLERFYGAAPRQTMQALAAVLDGDPICIAGTFVDRERKVAFADIRPVMRERFRKTGMRMARAVMNEIRKSGAHVVTIADRDVEAAARFLEHLGFQPIRDGVYSWRA